MRFLILLIGLFLPSIALASSTCTQEPETTMHDCFYMESYDKENKKCISRIPQTSPMQKAIAKRMNHIGQYAPEFTEQNNALTHDETQNIFTYEILKQAIVNPFPHPNEKLLQVYGDKKVHWKIWKAITKMYPKKYREEIQLFRIFSDGAGKETARVGLLQMPRQKNTSAWGIAVDPADRDDLPYTLLHELAHILIESPQERAREARFLSCTNSGEKTSIRNSYFRLFAEQFWENPPSLLKRGLGGVPEGNIFDLPPAQLEEIAKEYGPFFITEYATKNVTEDFAETFAHFVLLERPEENKTILDQKLTFFWQFEEMQRLRDSLRFGVLMLVGK